MDRPTRRLRFYKPEGSDVNSCIDSPILEPSGPAPRIKASRRRWTDSVSASRSTDAQASSQRMSVATGTPVSKGTPETLRTLELNWRDRRRAKLEDITLQRVMGVEKRGKLQEEITSGVARKHTGLQTQPLDARTTKDRPLRDIEASSQAGKETAILRSEAVSNGLKPTDNVSRPRDGHKIPLTGITTAATTTNNTTYQTGANKARKIVKLVRDARLSVQASEEQVSARVPADAKDHASAGHLSKAQGIPVKRTLDLPLKSVPARLPSATTSTKPPPVIAQRTSATPRRVSILREAPSQQKNGSAHCYSQPSTGSRFPRSSVLTSRNIDALYPITVSPLPAQEYPLSSTATLIVYPYEQDWSVDLPSQAASPEGQSGSSRRRQPVMSALTASERIDILDEGKTMRIKSTSKHSSAKTKPSRFLRLKERDSWREVDQRRWTLLQLLVDRLKRRTRRVTYEFPQGTLHVMCNDPSPDIVFYTNIVRPPTLHKDGREKISPDYDLTCDTSALLTASTDMSGICRARIMFSPTRGVLKLSTRCGLSSHRSHSHRSQGYGKVATDSLTPRDSETQSFRSRRIVHLPVSTSTDSGTDIMVEHLERLYQEQRSVILREPLVRKPPDGDQVWQMYELQSLARFLGLKGTWSGERS